MIRTLLRWMLKPLSFVPALCMMYIIFMFSGQEGTDSSQLSHKVSAVVIDVVDDTFDMGWTEDQKDAYTDKINIYVRKTAHVTEYFLLAAAVSLPMYVYGIRNIFLMIFAGGFCVAFACLDEYHQSFVAGRSSSMRDVMIDSIGIVVGVIVIQIICFIGRKTIFSPLAKDSKKKRRYDDYDDDYYDDDYYDDDYDDNYDDRRYSPSRRYSSGGSRYSSGGSRYSSGSGRYSSGGSRYASNSGRYSSSGERSTSGSRQYSSGNSRYSSGSSRNSSSSRSSRRYRNYEDADYDYGSRRYTSSGSRSSSGSSASRLTGSSARSRSSSSSRSSGSSARSQSRRYYEDYDDYDD